MRPFFLLLLAAIVPGAGHAVIGASRSALVLISPFALLFGIFMGAALGMGPAGIAGWLLSSTGLTVLALLNLLFALLRAGALFDMVRRARSAGLRAIGGTLIVLTVVFPHLYVGQTIAAVAGSMDRAFETPPLEEGETAPSGPVVLPWVVPAVTSPAGDDGRLDILLIGSDAGPGRWGRRTDVMMLASIDVATGIASLTSLPRNWRYIPLPAPAASFYKDGIFPGILNEMYTRGGEDEERWPGDTYFLRGVGAVRSTIAHLIDRPIDGVVLVDLGGFIRIIDALGGVTIDVERTINDPDYSDGQGGFGKRLVIKKGIQKMDGALAIAYVRSRHDSSDYDRMARQQRFLAAVAKALGPSAILNAPTLAAAAEGMVWTDLPRESLPALADLMAKMLATDDLRTLRFVPPTYPQYLTAASIAKIRAAVAGSIDPK
jgi:LCP family protein required for cell wall assembly